MARARGRRVPGAPGTGPKGLDDALRAGHSAAELRALAEERSAPVHAIASAVRGWLNREGKGTVRIEEREGRRREILVLAESLEATGVLEADGIPVAVSARVGLLSGTRREVVIPATVVVSRDPARELLEATGIPWTPKDAACVAQWAGDALMRTDETSVPRAQVLSRPHWDGERLLVPGGDLALAPARGAPWLGAYGRCANLAEEEARRRWTEVYEIAREHPRLAVMLGAALGSVYLAPLGRPSFVVHHVGESTRGKTSALRAAMATVGDPDLLVRSWNTTINAISERLEVASILPVALDELAAAGIGELKLETMVFRAAGGVGRSRAGREGGLREDGHWELVILSTGERGLRSASGLSGPAARVLEILAPATGGREASDAAHRAACAAYGWPLRWLVADPGRGGAKEMFARIEAALCESTEEPLARRLAGSVALCALGFATLGRQLDAPDAEEAAIRAARAVLTEASATLQEEGETAADRLHDAVLSAAIRRPFAFPPKDRAASAEREIEGVEIPEGLAVFPAALRRIAEEVGISDPAAALRDLAARGDLLRQNRKRLQRVLRIGERTVRAYVFRPRENDAAGTLAPEE